MSSTDVTMERASLFEPSRADGFSDRETRLTLVSLVRSVLKYRRACAIIPLATAILVVAVSLVRSNRFKSELSFTPASQDVPQLSLGQLSSLAAQFGFSLPNQGQTPAFYVQIVESDGFLRSVAQSSYEVLVDGKPTTTTVAQLYDVSGDTQGETIDETITLLRDELIDASFDAETGLVTIGVTTKWPDLSRALGAELLAKLEEFDRIAHQKQAAAESQFMGERVDSARKELRSAEDDLLQFLERNREFRSDPRLVFENDRLQRVVSMRQDVYSSVEQAYEQARIESARTTPSLVVVQPPLDPLRPMKRHLIVKAVLGLLLGALGTALLIIIREWWLYSRRQSPEEYAEVSALAMKMVPGRFRRR